MGQLADAGGGMFHDIARAEGIPAAIGGELGDALEVVHPDVRVRLAWQADLRVEAIGPWRTESADHGLTIHAGDMVSDQVLDLLVSVCFPSGAIDTNCPVRVLVRDGDRTLAENEFRWTWVDSVTRNAQPRQADVERRVADYFAQQARCDAVAANRAGDLKRARDALRTAAQRIRKYAKGDPDLLALAAELEGEVERHRRTLGARRIKEMFAETGAERRGRRTDGSRIRGDAPPALRYLPYQDSPELAERCRQQSQIPHHQAAALGKSALETIASGRYSNAAGQTRDLSATIATAVAVKRSLSPDTSLPTPDPVRFRETSVQVINEITLAASWRLAQEGRRVLALSFANGIHPGGGFVKGNRGQESVLCRSSALYATLEGDPMYAAHAARPEPDSTDWAILSPDVPVFRADEGSPLEEPWLLGILTCAAPYAPKLGRDRAGDLMESRIRRVLAIARAFDYEDLVLGAWGCGTYDNDPARIAAIFRAALEEQAGAFRQVVFAIADWSPERRFLAPFAAELSDRR